MPVHTVSYANIFPPWGKKHTSRKSIFLKTPRAVLSSPFTVIRAFLQNYMNITLGAGIMQGV